MKVGVLLIATNKYLPLIDQLVDSIREFFFSEEDVTVFLFTDLESQRTDLVPLYIPHKPWPLITLERYNVFHRFREQLRDQDYLFYLDADSRVAGKVGKEILPTPPAELVATIHPGYIRSAKRGPYEKRCSSTAYVKPTEGRRYYTGAFNGGTTTAFLQMAETIAQNVDQDSENNLIAAWHDESHLNRYLMDRNIRELSPAYCYPEKWNLPFRKIILALAKDHAAYRRD